MLLPLFKILSDIFYYLLDIYVLVYLDDIIVFSNSEEEHVTHVSTVLSRLRANNHFSKASKCLFHVKTLWQYSQHRSIFQELDKGKSVQDYFIDSSSQLLLSKEWVVLPNDPIIQLSILQKKELISSSWTPWPREASQTFQEGFSLVQNHSIYQGLGLILSTVLNKQEYPPQGVWTTRTSPNSEWSLDLASNARYHSTPTVQLF
ncbi:hypothetical protein O181_011536 [Austropuccinia psidii MF-1]|uniref:Reverse transcriptase domain-containing protein n=1 Tax=Austropuccinia psidii MF-1 TaxID=1389203 RepID=A0A9Q3GLF1_9BASI|nr:hypothetical protein [Austropuccinia psidii MF-1]